VFRVFWVFLDLLLLEEVLLDLLALLALLDDDGDLLLVTQTNFLREFRTNGIVIDRDKYY